MVAVVSASHAVVVQPCRRSISSWSNSMRCVLCSGKWLLVKVPGPRWHVRWQAEVVSLACLESLVYPMEWVVCPHSLVLLLDPAVARKLARLHVKRSANRSPGVEGGNACNCRTL